MIITEINKLKTPCIPVESMTEGEEIAIKLLQELVKSKNGMGLAANQIGINKRVCVVNVMEEPLILVNPKIIGLDNEYHTIEGCLSFPNKTVKTKRYEYVTVECDNLGKVMFGPTGDNGDTYNDKQNLQLLESVCVQHEIGHLDGLTMYDFVRKLQPIISNKKYKRNQKVKITDGKEIKTMKWKKAEPIIGIENGEWSLVLDSTEF
jgi:peptide deformylase